MYFTHPCAIISASAIPDRLLKSQFDLAINAVHLACNLNAMVEVLPNYPLSYEDRRNLDGLAFWCAASIDHALWALVYGGRLIDEYNKIYNAHLYYPQVVKLTAIVTSGAPKFPHAGWRDPAIDFPADCVRASVMESYRALFASVVRLSAFRRVRRPYWMEEAHAHAFLDD